MRKSVIFFLLLLTPTLLYARITKEQVVGNWKLLSKSHYLTLSFNRKGFVNITEGSKNHKPEALPLGIWSTLDDNLRITINGKTKFLYKHVRFRGRTITTRTRHGKVQHFHYTPPASYRTSP